MKKRKEGKKIFKNRNETNGCNGEAVSKRMPAEKHNSLFTGLDIQDMYIESIFYVLSIKLVWLGLYVLLSVVPGHTLGRYSLDIFCSPG